MLSRATKLSSGTSTPRRAPIVRGAAVMGVASEFLADPLTLMLRSHEQYGDVVQLRLPLLPAKIFATRDPELTRRILLADEKTVRKHDLLASALRAMLGPGLFTLSGSTWREIRDRQAASFSRAEIDALGDVITAGVERMLATWPAQQGAVDIARAVAIATLHITLEGLLGLSDTSSSEAIYDAFEEVQKQLTGMTQVLQLFSWLPTESSRSFRHLKHVLSQLVQRVIDNAAAQARPALHLAAILSAKDPGTGQPLTRERLGGEIINTLFAGYETTAVTLSHALRMLSTHPVILSQVEAETARVLGGRTPSIADVRQLEGLVAVVQETLRMFPPVWAQQRTNLVDIEYEGYRFPRGSLMIISTWALHRHPQHWANPEAFMPARFSKDASAKRHAFAHVPFGGGARTCIGRHLALVESVMILAMVLQRYELLGVSGNSELLARFTLRTHPLEFRVQKRERLLGTV